MVKGEAKFENPKSRTKTLRTCAVNPLRSSRRQSGRPKPGVVVRDFRDIPLLDTTPTARIPS